MGAGDRQSNQGGFSEEFEDLVTACIEALEAGDQETARELMRDHPQHVTALREVLSSLEHMGLLGTEEPEKIGSEVGVGEEATVPDSGALRVGPYRIERELGRGGQGVVYLARDELGRAVALKVLEGLSVTNPRARRRLRREASATGRLRHPGVCTVYAAHFESGVPYIAMEYLQGETLAQRIAGQRERNTNTHLDAAAVLEVVRVVEATSLAVHEAHEVGIVHRDLKPANIMIVASGDPVVLDFGLAGDETEVAGTLTRGEVFGSPAYMSPEQVDRRGRDLDRRTDVWSLGVTLFEALTLRLPFDATSRASLFVAILTEDAPDPRRWNPAISKDLAVVIEHALSPERDRRYQTALALAKELGRIREGVPVLARPVPRWHRVWRLARRHPVVTGTVSFALVALSVGLLVSLSLLRARDAALRRYGQMSDAHEVDALLAEEPMLWPRRPWRLPAMDRWLGRARSLLLERPRHAEALRELRRRALPTTADEEALDRVLRRQRHSQLHERVDVLQTELATLRAQERRTTRPKRRDQLAERIQGVSEELVAQTNRPEFSERVTFTFAAREDAWRHDVLVDLASKWERLLVAKRSVEERREFAATVRALTVDAHRDAWRRCAEDVRTSSRYGGFVLEPQVGLVPLGRHRESGLWEFWLVESGPRPTWEGDSVSGRARVVDDQGLVFVLVPGGSFSMGAQNDDPASANYDADLDSDGLEEGVHVVALDAFLLSKFEMTQAQWERVMGQNPSYHRAGGRPSGVLVTRANPVEHVDWFEATNALARLDVVLPTEAQWECAARGGKPHAWWTGNDVTSLQGTTNVADRTASRDTVWECEERLEDGHVCHAPVGSFRENPFGFHDVIGNVREWCRDPWVDYARIPPAPGDGYRSDPHAPLFVNRGGAFLLPPSKGRAAARYGSLRHQRFDFLGVRPARRLVRE